MKFEKIIILCFFFFFILGCKESPVLMQFQSEIDELIREYTNNVDNKIFYVYASNEKGVYIIDYVGKNTSVNFDERIGYWELSNGLKITVLPEGVVEEIHNKLLLEGKLKTGGILVVKLNSKEGIVVEMGQ